MTRQVYTPAVEAGERHRGAVSVARVAVQELRGGAVLEPHGDVHAVREVGGFLRLIGDQARVEMRGY